MLQGIFLPNSGNEQAPSEKELARLKQPGALQRRLAEFDNRRPLRRIYVMGCGRSGTWLLTHVMGTFFDVELVRRELPVEYFGLLSTDLPVLVLKRDRHAYQWAQQIPSSVEIAYIVRHPYDVLTSQLPGSQRPYHILPERWVGELTALRQLVVSKRKMIKIIRYEDLVSHPIASQKSLGGFFGLKVRVPIEAFFTASNNPTESPLHRSRKIDTSSIGKYKREQAKLSYLAQIKPQLGEILEWAGKTYAYDLSI
jgi:hypothetical protein